MFQEYQFAPVTSVAPAVITIKPTPACDKFASYREAAAYWFNFGFNVIPIIPGKKIPAVKWDQWLDGLSNEKIAKHWARNPDHELGFVVGDNTIVFDADSPESMAALAIIEKAFDLTPNLVVKTNKGTHHYFKRAQGAYAKSDSHSTAKHPCHLDIKTDRALIILPPSTGKEVVINEADGASDLTEVGQDAIDAFFKHNGRPVPRLPEASAFSNLHPNPFSKDLVQLIALLDHIEPSSGYDTWLRVLMAIFNETGGSMEGMELADAWSRMGSNYQCSREISAKWKSFRLDHPNPVTIASLKKMVADNGHDWMAICSATESPFTRIDDEKGVM